MSLVEKKLGIESFPLIDFLAFSHLVIRVSASTVKPL